MPARRRRSRAPAEGRNILAGYTCTPVAHFPIDALGEDTRIRGRTVAELGAMNTPLDMVAHVRDDAGALHLRSYDSASL